MSLIFHQFPTRERAEAFVAEVKRVSELDGQVFETEEDAFAHDPFPYELTGIIVHIDRPDSGSDDSDMATERAIERIAPEYAGDFAGT
jgi:hypothetical protein